MYSPSNGVQVQNIAVTSIFGLLSLFAVLARLISRRLRHLRLLSSDYFMVLAWIFVLACIIANHIAVLDGNLGEHQEKLSLENNLVYLKSIFALQIMWAAAEGAVKTSMCLFYLQLFPQRSFHIAAWAVIGFCNAFAVSVILGTALVCEPVAFNYDPTIQGSCGNRVGMWVAIGVLNIVTDLCVVFLPTTVLWKLSLKTSKKIGLVIIFSLGAVVCIISGVRLKFLLDVQFDGDASFQIATANLWSILEPTTAITVGCIPTMKPLYDFILRRPRSTSRHSSYFNVKSTPQSNATFATMRLPQQDYSLTEISAIPTQVRKNRSLGSGDRSPTPSNVIETTHHVEVNWDRRQ